MKVLWISAAFMALLLIGYIVSQQPRLCLSSETFGLVLLKGGYRSWLFSWSDGHTFGPDGKWTSVVIDVNQGTMAIALFLDFLTLTSVG